MSDKKSAITSLLVGLATGDALGVPVEFRPRGSFQVTGMQGYGTHNQPPGTWSYDTSLAKGGVRFILQALFPKPQLFSSPCLGTKPVC